MIQQEGSQIGAFFIKQAIEKKRIDLLRMLLKTNALF
jgi:hypothetical protein